MAVDEAARHELCTRLEELLGRDPTSTMMELLPPTGWDDVVRQQDLAEFRTRVDQRFAEVDRRFAEVRTEIAELRGEMADEMRRMTLTLVGTMITISGVTVAAAGLL